MSAAAPAEAAVHERADVLARVRELHGELTEGGRRADAEARDPAENLAVLFRIGAGRLCVPTAYGGLEDGGSFAAWPAVIDTITEIASADGPTAQNWLTTWLVARMIFTSGMPPATLEWVADRLLTEGLRLVSSAAETGSGSGPVTARDVPGGVMVNGTKTFNSNSGDPERTLAHVHCTRDGVRGDCSALVALDDPGVTLHGDWDVMGQRGTCSQTVTYDDVFVPDGQHYRPEGVNALFVAAAVQLHAALLHGMADGAFRAMTGHVRRPGHRGTLPSYPDAVSDPLVQRRVGELSARLAASRALLRESARAVDTVDAVPAAIRAASFRSKLVASATALEISSALFDLTGARTTANSHGFDRYWRNARTFASHDPADAKNAYVGAWELTGTEPDFFAFQRA